MKDRIELTDKNIDTICRKGARLIADRTDIVTASKFRKDLRAALRELRDSK